MNDMIFGKNRLFPGKKTYIMGILNVTPDSFSDGGRYNNIKSALAHAEKMINDGADIIDIGAVSTRPFSAPVSPCEEWERLKDIVGEIKRNFNIPVSVDTFESYTAVRCLDKGVDIINDVSGRFSREMADVIKEYNSGWIIMHGGVGIRKAEEETEYKNSVTDDVNSFFSEMLTKISQVGILRENICLDPGFGFSKNTCQNVQLLKNLDMIDKHSCPLLCALSRKRFIGELTMEPDSEKRDNGTLAANIIAVTKGADILRVHDVALHKQAIALADGILQKK